MSEEHRYQGGETVSGPPVRPKLVGLIPLPIPHVKRFVVRDTEIAEEISYVAFDDKGGCWGVVVRMVPLPSEFKGAARLDVDRFVPIGRLPFVEDDPTWRDLKRRP